MAKYQVTVHELRDTTYGDGSPRTERVEMYSQTFDDTLDVKAFARFLNSDEQTN